MAMFLYAVLVLLFVDDSFSQRQFRAAVYEHAVVLPFPTVLRVSRATALNNMMKNLEMYKLQTQIASHKGVQMIVFPEDGIYGPIFMRYAIEPYLEEIPDPKTELSNPCSESGDHKGKEVQHYLSCLARNNSLYLVANFGDYQTCSNTSDTNCPSGNHYQYNTDVVYNTNGTLIAKYHKEHLFYENQFDKPKHVELVYFDTEFGRFGVFTCFDIMFREPPITLFERYGVTNIVFPTAWIDALPLLAAIQFHSAFATGLGINLLSANIHLPALRFHGSGIYTPAGATAYYYNNTSPEGKLLVADIDVMERVVFDLFTPAIEEYAYGCEFHSLVFHDLYNMVALEARSGQLTVCHNKLCCSLEYAMASHSEHDLYAFGAFDGLHTVDGVYYLQVCVLLKCLTNQKETCGKKTQLAETTFSSLKIQGNFSESYIYPGVLTSQGGSLMLAVGEWKYKEGVLTSDSGISIPLITASLVSRQYDKDGIQMSRAPSNVCTNRFIVTIFSCFCLSLEYYNVL